LRKRFNQSGSISTAVVLTEQNCSWLRHSRSSFDAVPHEPRKVGHQLVPGALILREALLVIPDPYTRVEVDGTQDSSCDAVPYFEPLVPIELGLFQQTTIDRVHSN
jgi:hypothetical protein